MEGIVLGFTIAMSAAFSIEKSLIYKDCRLIDPQNLICECSIGIDNSYNVGRETLECESLSKTNEIQMRQFDEEN